MNADQQNTVNRMNDLAVESAQTFVDAAYLAQRQSAQLLQAWLNTLDSAQQSQRELASTLVRQSQEAQRLLQQYVQDSFRESTDTFTKVAREGVRQASDTFANAAQQAEATRNGMGGQ